ncbi:hypothetical protein ADIARSV_0641 [Arcticibacter svalbardensis MN12-7]|uniref:Uncharacterized protein n=1 Tax=Arcticibacter svalbardensis MN12-7 TaxID=1150600 RepID=R9GWV6_9SPHI|nr:hypothetical protein ADIARSV_0641 [Arcticibacter svalbardensis MN12-7]
MLVDTNLSGLVSTTTTANNAHVVDVNDNLRKIDTLTKGQRIFHDKTNSV